MSDVASFIVENESSISVQIDVINEIIYFSV